MHSVDEPDSELINHQLRSLDSSTRLVITHPNFASQHMLLDSALFNAVSHYCRLRGEQLSYSQLGEQIANQSISIANRSEKTGWLILDEADRALDAALAQFAEGYLAQPATRLLLITRRFPESISASKTLRGMIRLLPVDAERLLWDYANFSPRTNRLLEVRAFGIGRVQIDGREVEHWDGVLPRSLCFFMVDRGMVTRAEIFDTFWPTLSIKDATNVFHVTKRKVNELLGVELAEYDSGFYRIAGNLQLEYDARLFTRLVQEAAIADAGQAMALLERAIDLYQAEFLTTLDQDWVVQRSEALRGMLIDAHLQKGELHQARGEQPRALASYFRAYALNPLREDIALLIMQSLEAGGERHAAIEVFEHLQMTLRERLNLAPSERVEALARRLKG